MSKTLVSYEDDLAAEQKSELKHERLDGMIYAMSRGVPEHARVSANVTSALRIAFKVSVRSSAPIAEGSRGPGTLDGEGTSMNAKSPTS